MLIEGLTVTFPRLGAQLDIFRIAFARLRQDVFTLIGPDNQSLPILILADDTEAELSTDDHEGRRFVKSYDAVLEALARVPARPILSRMF